MSTELFQTNSEFSNKSPYNLLNSDLYRNILQFLNILITIHVIKSQLNLSNQVKKAKKLFWF